MLTDMDHVALFCILQRLNADGDKIRFDQVIGDCLNILKVRKATDISYQRSIKAIRPPKSFSSRT